MTIRVEQTGVLSRVLALTEKLTPPEKLYLSEKLMQQLREIIENAERIAAPGKRRKLSDFAGVGKDLWQMIDVDEYVRQERESWDRPNF
ncbi:MAG: hypothetical protein DWI57_06975 [Chloroflexi bacterium]|nr:MAG: hypothetical protein DWI57_06975 [Chloroflexota bacterium]